MKLINKIGSGAYKDGSSITAGWTYHPIPFNKYSYVPAHKVACYKEFEVINKYLKRGKRLLDIGCAAGFYIFNLRNDFKELVGVERDENVLALLKELKREFKIKNIKFYQSLNKVKGQFDTTLMLNVHMWIRKQEGEKRTKEIMKRLRTKHLFFQTAHAESGGMYQVKELKNKNDIKNYLEECGFKSKLIHTSPDHGGVRYMFYGKRI